MSRRWQRSRGAVANLSVWIFGALLLTELWSDGFSLSGWLRSCPLLSFASFGLLVLGIYHGAALLTPDRAEGILPLLLITRQSGHHIVQNKIAHGLLLELTMVFGMLPAAVIPLAMMGYSGLELLLITLGCLNVLFVSMSLGLLASVFLKGSKAGAVCFVFLLPWIVYSTPLIFLSGWADHRLARPQPDFKSLRASDPCAISRGRLASQPILGAVARQPRARVGCVVLGRGPPASVRSLGGRPKRGPPSFQGCGPTGTQAMAVADSFAQSESLLLAGGAGPVADDLSLARPPDQCRALVLADLVVDLSKGDQLYRPVLGDRSGQHLGTVAPRQHSERSRSPILRGSHHRRVGIDSGTPLKVPELIHGQWPLPAPALPHAFPARRADQFRARPGWLFYARFRRNA